MNLAMVSVFSDPPLGGIIGFWPVECSFFYVIGGACDY